MEIPSVGDSKRNLDDFRWTTISVVIYSASVMGLFLWVGSVAAALR